MLPLCGVGAADGRPLAVRTDPPIPVAVDEAAAAGIGQSTAAWGAGIGDFNNDGWPDFLLSRHAEHPAQLWLNDEAGHFSLSPTTFPQNVERLDCVAGNFNGDDLLDGFCDRGATDGTAEKADELWIQQSSGLFADEAAQAGVMDPFGRGRHVVTIDANHDGLDDLFVGNSPERPDGLPSPNRLFLNVGNGTFRDAPDFGLDQEIGSTCAVTGDFDADGYQDLLVCPEGGRSVRLYRNDAGAGFTDVSSLLGTNGDAADALMTDLNGDGRSDVVEVFQNQLVVLLQQLDGTFQPSYSLALFSGTGVAAGDANGDGTTDLYVVQGSAGQVANEPDLMLLNDGDGTSFLQMDISGTEASDGSGSRAYALDYDGNGLTDFLVFNGANSGGPIQLIAFFPTGASGRAVSTPARTTPAGAAPASIGSANAVSSPSLRTSAGCGSSWATTSLTVAQSRDDILDSIATITPSDMWAVGQYGAAGKLNSATVHWDGTSWNVVANPDAANTENVLNDVSAASSSDVWAVGTQADTTTALVLVDHWDGTQWSAVAAPNPASTDLLLGVSAVASNDAWAVGYQGTDSGHVPLLEHWDGTQWSVVAAPAPTAGWTGDTALTDVTAVSSSDVWAVGHAGSLDGYRTLVMHYDGLEWSIVASPNTGTVASGQGDNVLNDVSASGPSDVWAVGYSYSATAPGYRTLAEHYDGSQWSILDTPNAGIQPLLRGVHAFSSGDVWAVGTFYSASARRWLNLSEHDDGTGWLLAMTPNLPADNQLLAAGGTAADKWAVGVGNDSFDAQRVCPIQVTDADSGAKIPRVHRGSTVVWQVAASDAESHSVTDGSGMGLFDSGLRAPGGSFAFTFFGAGRYPVVDQATGAASSVSVPMMAKPGSGATDTQFTLTWASSPPPDGFVFDVQLKVPGSVGWSSWLTGQTGAGVTFTPSAGTGTYSFRARLRRSATGAASKYSPPSSVAVS